MCQNTTISDHELLREVMNTVVKRDQLGAQVRCVVSVSMLTDGWDANNVTHILGVRAFGTQLLCEQVIGRGLRRRSYDQNEEGLYSPEYADIFGIPFDFTAQPVNAPIQPRSASTICTSAPWQYARSLISSGVGALGAVFCHQTAAVCTTGRII